MEIEALENTITFGDSVYIGRGRHQQEIFVEEQSIGWLDEKEGGILTPIATYWHIPDVEYEVDPDDNFCDVKVFTSDEDALAYIGSNLEEIKKRRIKHYFD